MDDDPELIELIRRGANSWRGWSGSASAARYRRKHHRVRRPYVTMLFAAAAALLVLEISLAGGPGPAFHSLVVVATRAPEPQPSPVVLSSPRVDEPAPKTNPVTNSEPPAAAKSEPSPTPAGEGPSG